MKSVGTQTLDSFGLCEKDTYAEPDLFERETLFLNTKEPGSENKSIEMYPLTKTHLASHLKMISDDDEKKEVSMAASSKFNSLPPAPKGSQCRGIDYEKKIAKNRVTSAFLQIWPTGS